MIKKITPYIFSTLIFLSLVLGWEKYVKHWEKTQHTGGAVIRVDILMIYPLAFLVAVGVFFGIKNILNRKNEK